MPFRYRADQRARCVGAAEVLNLLADLWARHGLTTVMVSHNVAVVAHLCPRIAVMQLAEIVETLTTEDLRAGRTRHPHTSELRALSTELAHAGATAGGLLSGCVE